MNSIPSSHEGSESCDRERRKSYRDFRSPCLIFLARLAAAPWWWWKARSSDLCLTETTAMIIFGPLLVIAGIGFFCWLLFTLAVFALPFYAGLTLRAWAFHTGAGWLGGAIVGVIAAGVTFAVGQLALAFAPWTWLRLAIVLVYAAPATVAGYYATHGIAQMAMPSATWQMIFSLVGAVAVGITALIRIAGATPLGRKEARLARA
jgi:hypothetical protein